MKLKRFRHTPHTCINRDYNSVDQTQRIITNVEFQIKSRYVWTQFIAMKGVQICTRMYLLPGANLHPGANSARKKGFVSFMFPKDNAQQIQKLGRRFRN